MAKRTKLDPLFYPVIDWQGDPLPKAFVKDQSLYLRLRDSHFPRLRVELSSDEGGGEDALHRIVEGKGGAEVTVRTVPRGHVVSTPFPDPQNDPYELLGYRQSVEELRAGRGKPEETLPRLDTQMGVMILQIVRLAVIARDHSHEKRSEARERLRQASRALGVFWPGPHDESIDLTKQADIVEELAWLLKAARKKYRKVLNETFSETAATKAARKDREQSIRFTMKLWELADGSPNWDMIKYEAGWLKLFATPSPTGSKVGQDLARQLLGVTRESYSA